MNEYIEEITTQNPEALIADGYDDCIVGIVRRCGHEPLLCYDINLMIAKMCHDDDMTEEEAREHFEYNVIGAWLGNGTPVFIES